MITHVLPLLIVSGPVGVGKTTVTNEISLLLERSGVFHTLLDMDVLAETYPRPHDDPFAKGLAVKNLRDIWVNCAAAKSRNLVIPRVIETRRDVEEIERAVPGSKATVCQLRASNDILIARVRARELGLGREWHEARSLELARSLQQNAPVDFIVETDNRLPLDIAQEIVARVTWATGD